MSVLAGPDGQFSAGSFDSLSAVELSTGIATALNLQLPSTLVFDYPSISALAANLHSLLAPPAEAAAVIVAPTHVTAASLAAITQAPHTRQLLAQVLIAFNLFLYMLGFVVSRCAWEAAAQGARTLGSWQLSPRLGYVVAGDHGQPAAQRLPAPVRGTQ